jgi:hypothetical protein
MKPITDNQKEKMFDDIRKSLSYIYEPAPGEFTLREMVDALEESGSEISKDKVRHRLGKLVSAEVLGVRDINVKGSRMQVFLPLREISYEEIVEILLAE